MSVWALPCARDVALLQPTIDRLAAAVDTPPFAPHITLLGDGVTPNVDGIGDFSAVDVALVELADEDFYFRCLTLTAEPNDALLALHEAVANGDTSSYAPHLSLAYAELLHIDRFPLRAMVDLALPMTITIDAVALVDTSGPVETWTPTETWPLS